MLHSIGGDLIASLKKAGIKNQIDAAALCDSWEKVVTEIFGLQVAGRSQALKFRNGTLTVAVLDSVLAQEFKFKEAELKAKLNSRRFGFVKKIRFEL